MAGEIVVKCQNCGHKLKADSENIGRKGRCPNCNATIRLQSADAGDGDDGGEQVVRLETVPTRKDALLRVQKQDDVAVISFVTSRILDQSNVQQLGEEFEAVVEEHGFKKVVVNFENVSYMSSAVMGKLVALLKKLQAVGGELRLCNIEEGIYEIFEIMRFDRMFDIAPGEQQAILDLTE